MHMFSREKNFFGGRGIVGANVPIGTGLASPTVKKNGAVCLTYFRDGAANQGQVFNPSTWPSCGSSRSSTSSRTTSTPGTSVSRSTAEVHLWRGASRNIPGEAVDGMDVERLQQAESGAVGTRRQRPYILEMKTYRYRGHSMSDPAKYRTREEVQQMREKHDRSKPSARGSRASACSAKTISKPRTATCGRSSTAPRKFATDRPSPLRKSSIRTF
jgi:pyruvate dehydrogenase E1 component alpha subunit